MRHLHDLRGTHITLAVESGTDAKTISDRVGHTTVRTTLDRYTKPSKQAHRAAADRVGDIMDRAIAAGDKEARTRGRARSKSGLTPKKVGVKSARATTLKRKNPPKR